MRRRHPACVICRVPHGVSIMVRNQDRGARRADDGCRATDLLASAFGTQLQLMRYICAAERYLRFWTC